MDAFPIYDDSYKPELDHDTSFEYNPEYITSNPIYIDEPDYDNEPYEDIHISDSYVEVEDDVDDELAEPWLPYSDTARLPNGNGNQQVIIGGFPQPSALKQHYCDLYPEECAKNGNILEQNNTLANNYTLNDTTVQPTDLAHVNFPGVGLALLLLFLILLGLNGSWSGDKTGNHPDGSQKPDRDHRKNGTKGSEDGKDTKGQKSGKLHKNGEPAEGRKRTKEQEEADRKRQKEKDRKDGKNRRGDEERNSRKGRKHGETPEDEKDRKRREQRQQEKAQQKKDADKAKQERKDRDKRRQDRETNRKDRGQSGRTPEEEKQRQRQKQRDQREKDKKKDRDAERAAQAAAADDERRRKDRNQRHKDQDRKDRGKDRKHGRKHSDGSNRDHKSETQADRDEQKRREKDKKRREQERAIRDSQKDTHGDPKKDGKKHSGQTQEEREKRKQEKHERDKKRKAQEDAQKKAIEDQQKKDQKEAKKKAERDRKHRKRNETPEERDERYRKNGETPDQRDERHKREKAQKDAKAQAERDRKHKKRNETPEERDERYRKNGETPEQRDERHKREKAQKDAKAQAERDERHKKNGETPEQRDKRHKREKAERDAKRQAEQDARNGTGSNDNKGSFWLNPSILLGLLLLLGLLAFAGKAQVSNTIPNMNWRTPSFFQKPSGIIGGSLLGEGGGLSGKPIINALPKIIPSRPKSSSWVVKESSPHIHINNLQTNGNGNPVTFGPSPNPVGQVVIEAEVPVVQEKVWEPISFQFNGPSNPDRLLNMVLAILIISLPLIIDWIKDYPEERYSSPHYISSMIQTLILAALVLFGLLIADWHFGWSTTIAPYTEVSLDGVQSGLTPVLVGAVETTEHLVWGLEDVLFGDGRILLGMGLAALGCYFLSQREPSSDTPTTAYSDLTTQALVFLGALILGMIFWNA
ncbi:uncharacterized protein L201_000464 [Kwoniella dendrophila CBS 6074]|uniref:Uncharacterized protein n=1 Tax=Kwoniella dendrophila CBS 6074 TaxID=1295534 RepID=A0AAX4JJN0_9TREE